MEKVIKQITLSNGKGLTVVLAEHKDHTVEEYYKHGTLLNKRTLPKQDFLPSIYRYIGSGMFIKTKKELSHNYIVL